MSTVSLSGRRERGTILQNDYGQYFYVCCTCHIECVTAGSFKDHQTNAHGAKVMQVVAERDLTMRKSSNTEKPIAIETNDVKAINETNTVSNHAVVLPPKCNTKCNDINITHASLESIDKLSAAIKPINKTNEVLPHVRVVLSKLKTFSDAPAPLSKKSSTPISQVVLDGKYKDNEKTSTVQGIEALSPCEFKSKQKRSTSTAQEITPLLPGKFKYEEKPSTSMAQEIRPPLSREYKYKKKRPASTDQEILPLFPGRYKYKENPPASMDEDIIPFSPREYKYKERPSASTDKEILPLFSAKYKCKENPPASTDQDIPLLPREFKHKDKLPSKGQEFLPLLPREYKYKQNPPASTDQEILPLLPREYKYKENLPVSMDQEIPPLWSGKYKCKESPPASTDQETQPLLPGKYRCKNCIRTFNSLIDFDSHAENCMLKQKIECDYCPKTFETTNGLRLHIRKNHQSKLPHLCHVCPKSFNHRQDLKEHSLQHSSNRMIRCEFCGRRLLSAYEKENHIKRCHPHAVYECKFCSYKCKTDATLRIHESNKHHGFFRN